MNPSPSSSYELAHAAGTSPCSRLSVAEAQSGSAVSPAGGVRSMSPSSSSSMPLTHSASMDGITGKDDAVSEPAPRGSARAALTTPASLLAVIVAATAGGPERTT